MAFASPGNPGFISKSKHVTIALTDVTGSAAIEQEQDGDTFAQVVQGGEDIVLDPDNTMRAIYSPCRLRVTATGSDVTISG